MKSNNNISHKILLVDDEHIIRMALKKNLSKSGYDVDACESGEEALKLLDKQTYDLLLTDYLMVGMNGSELIEKVKKLAPEIKTMRFSMEVLSYSCF